MLVDYPNFKVKLSDSVFFFEFRNGGEMSKFQSNAVLSYVSLLVMLVRCPNFKVTLSYPIIFRVW